MDIAATTMIRHPPVEVALFNRFPDAAARARELATKYHERVEIQRVGRQWSVRAGTRAVAGLMGWTPEAREAARRVAAERNRRIEPTDDELDDAVAEQHRPEFKQQIEEALDRLAMEDAQDDSGDEYELDDELDKEQHELLAEIVEDEENYARSDEDGWLYSD